MIKEAISSLVSGRSMTAEEDTPVKKSVARYPVVYLSTYPDVYYVV